MRVSMLRCNTTEEAAFVAGKTVDQGSHVTRHTSHVTRHLLADVTREGGGGLAASAQAKRQQRWRRFGNR